MLMAIIAQAQVNIRIPQSGKVPLRGFYNVYLDGDYAKAINPSPIPAWPDSEGWRGFGTGQFGAGQFGFGDVGLRFGCYRFGMGRFGFGALMLRFTTPKIADGAHTLNAVGFDEAGNPASPSGGKAVAITVAGVPRPPGTPTAESYDDATDTLNLAWALSGDDEG